MSQPIPPGQADLAKLREQAAKTEQTVNSIPSLEATKAGTAQMPVQQWTPEIARELSFSILIFGLLVLGLLAWMVTKTKASLNGLLRAFALILIIVAAIFLIVAGYTEQQIAPAMGLLGTIAGYLLNTSRQAMEEREGRKQPAGE